MIISGNFLKSNIGQQEQQMEALDRKENVGDP